MTRFAHELFLLVALFSLTTCSVLPLEPTPSSNDETEITSSELELTSTPERQQQDDTDLKCYKNSEVTAELCSAFVGENCGSREMEDEEVDLQKLLDSWQPILPTEMPIVKHHSEEIAREQPKRETSNWRVSRSSMTTRNMYMFNEALYTDCAFVLGPENNTEVVRAHKVFLQRASPVFEVMFREQGGAGSRRIRVSDVSAKAFKTLLKSVYADEICLTSFDEACELLGVAARFGLPELAVHARAFLWSSLYPRNIWRGYQCAVQINDTELRDTALQLAKIRTTEALMDPTFSDIPQSTLVDLLSLDSLNVKSELQLYEASLRWAMKEAKRRDLLQEPTVLREVLGPALSLIRFLRFTPSEFANIQFTSKVLTYSESLAVIFNLNSPGVMPLPDNLSSNNRSRSAPETAAYFDVIGAPNSDCPYIAQQGRNRNTFDAFTMSTIKTDRTLQVIGIHIPQREDASCGYNEDLTVYFLNEHAIVVHTTHYKGQTTCADDLVYIPLDKIVSISSSKSYKIKIVLHVTGQYSTSMNKGIQHMDSTHRYTKGSSTTGYYWYMGQGDFVHSLVSTNYY